MDRKSRQSSSLLQVPQRTHSDPRIHYHWNISFRFLHFKSHQTTFHHPMRQYGQCRFSFYMLPFFIPSAAVYIVIFLPRHSDKSSELSLDLSFLFFYQVLFSLLKYCYDSICLSVVYRLRIALVFSLLFWREDVWINNAKECGLKFSGIPRLG